MEILLKELHENNFNPRYTFLHTFVAVGVKSLQTLNYKNDKCVFSNCKSRRIDYCKFKGSDVDDK